MMMQVDAVASTWELAKGVMLSLTTIGVGWTARTVFTLRDDVRDLKKSVGLNGNGLIAQANRNTARLDAINERHVAVDAIAAEYGGPERRHPPNRRRDE